MRINGERNDGFFHSPSSSFLAFLGNGFAMLTIGKCGHALNVILVHASDLASQISIAI